MTYRWNDARKDFVAGLTVAAISLPQAMAYALIAGVEPRFGLYSAIVVTIVASVLGSSSHLINGPTNAISLVVFSALAFVGSHSSGDPCCNRMAILDLEGEFFFGAAPELDRYLAELRERAKQGIRILILRVKRTRNPDMVCIERLQDFVEEMRRQNVPVLLCGVRPDFLETMKNLHSEQWLPPEHVFMENPMLDGTATLSAVRYAYQLLGDDVCDHCPHRVGPKPDSGTPQDAGSPRPGQHPGSQGCTPKAAGG